MRKKIKNKKSKQTIIVYLLLRFLVIVCMVAQSMNGNWENVLLCVLTLILFTLPTLISEKFNIELPSTLEIIVYLFIFASEILGEIQNFYGLIREWDSILHTINGFICAAIGFSLVDLLNSNKYVEVNLSPIFVCIVSICFSMTIGILWEFAEFSIDKYLAKDMQKDRIVTKISSVTLNKEGKNIPVVIDNINKTVIYSDNNQETVIKSGYLELGIIDTIKDLFVNFIGAIVFSIIGYLYIKNKEEYRLAEKFILSPKKHSNEV